jgi:hypothetical protein
MWSKRFLVVVLFPWTISTLSDPALADVQAVLACRRLPAGPARADCLERATADLEGQSGERVQGAPGSASGVMAQGGEQAARPVLRSRFSARVEAITYQDGRPIFQLDNGQTWYSIDRRRLTFKPGRSRATIEKTPVGMLLHFNGSFFALQVVPKQG